LATPDVTISIVNWNTRDELRECLDTVLAQDGQVTYEIVVIDNASSDGSAEMVRGEFADRVTLIANSRNIGFGSAHNQALKIAVGRYAMLLNPDCRILEGDDLRVMVDFMDENDDVGILGPKIVNPDGSIQFSARRFPTMFAAVFRHTLLGRLFPKNRFVRAYLMLDWAHDRTADVDWVSGAALMARRETVRSVGLLDERFFMYCEDVDWCRRAHADGWRVVYYPEACVSHRIGASSDQNPIPMIRQHHRSMLRYFLKHESRAVKIILLPAVMLALWIRCRSLTARVAR